MVIKLTNFNNVCIAIKCLDQKNITEITGSARYSNSDVFVI
jgi:hypothetical protein